MINEYFLLDLFLFILKFIDKFENALSNKTAMISLLSIVYYSSLLSINHRCFDKVVVNIQQ